MLQCLLLSHSPLRVQHKQSADEVNQIVTEVFRHLILQSFDFFRSHLTLFGFKRSPSAVELKGQHSDRPQIQPAIIGSLRNNFRADIVYGSTKSLAGAGRMY